MPDPKNERSIIFISHGYHLPRIIYACEHIGVSGTGFPAEELALIERSELSWIQIQQIRFQRNSREMQLLLLSVMNIYNPTLAVE